jgi:hypothetical protein
MQGAFFAKANNFALWGKVLMTANNPAKKRDNLDVVGRKIDEPKVSNPHGSIQLAASTREVVMRLVQRHPAPFPARRA